MTTDATTQPSAGPPRLLVHYRKEVVPTMIKEFGFSNALSVPRVEKIVVNMGIKEGATDQKLMDHLQNELAMIVGQQPVVKSRNGVMGRSVHKLCWPCCDHKATVVLSKCGKVRVR